MTVFDLDNLNAGAWFDYETDDEGEVISRVKVRSVTQELIETTRKKCSTVDVQFKSSFKHGPLQPVEIRETNDDEMRRILWDYILVDWDGLKLPDGTDIECTVDNKVALMGGSPEFYAFVDDKVDKLSSVIEARREQNEKN